MNDKIIFDGKKKIFSLETEVDENLLNKFRDSFRNMMKSAIMKKSCIFQKHIIHDDINWIKGHGCTVESVYRNVEVGEKVKCEVHENQNYFLTMPYYNTITEDGYNCCVNINDVELE